jgi:hypothetical protein
VGADDGGPDLGPAHAQYTRGTLASRAFVHRYDAVLPDEMPPSVLGPVGTSNLTLD